MNWTHHGAIHYSWMGTIGVGIIMVRLGYRNYQCRDEVYPRPQGFSMRTIILKRIRHLTIAIAHYFPSPEDTPHSKYTCLILYR
jgi:hypothetical protein